MNAFHCMMYLSAFSRETEPTDREGEREEKREMERGRYGERERLRDRDVYFKELADVIVETW